MPSPSRRRLIASRSSITLTEKCFPTSRRKSIAVSPDVHDRLFLTVAPGGPAKSTNPWSCPRIRSAHSATVSVVLSARSPVSRGSPIIPVAPPASTIGWGPNFVNRRSVNSGTRFPACRVGAVGSKPAYTVIGGRATSAASASRSVDCAISSRQLSSSRIVTPTPSIFPHVRQSPATGRAEQCRARREAESVAGAGRRCTRAAAVRRHLRPVGQPEPPCSVCGLADADARAVRDTTAAAQAEPDPTRPVEQIRAVVVHRDRQRGAQIARAPRQRTITNGCPATRASKADTLLDDRRSQWHGGRGSFGTAYDVRAYVDAVAAVRVEPTGPTEHHAVAAVRPAER